jgi:hypothetical protein
MPVNRFICLLVNVFSASVKQTLPSSPVLAKAIPFYRPIPALKDGAIGNQPMGRCPPLTYFVLSGLIPILFLQPVCPSLTYAALQALNLL